MIGKSHRVRGAQYADYVQGICDDVEKCDAMGGLAGLPQHIEDVSEHIFSLESLLHDAQVNLEDSI